MLSRGNEAHAGTSRIYHAWLVFGGGGAHTLHIFAFCFRTVVWLRGVLSLYLKKPHN